MPKINPHERQVLLKAIHFSEVGHKTPTKDTSGFCACIATAAKNPERNAFFRGFFPYTFQMVPLLLQKL